MIESRHRPTRVSVDLGKIEKNLQTVAANLPDQTAVFAVVKANAYGHGAIPVAKKLANQVSGFCVSNLDEALELRQAGIDKPILILGLVPVQYASLALEAGLSLTLANLDWLYQVEELGLDLTGLALHLKLDTGMGRIGFRKEDELQTALDLLEKLGVTLEGVYTHFATADEKEMTQFDSQLHRFQELLKLFPSLPIWVHASNSAASLWHKTEICNMVRLGNVLYGLNPSGHRLDLPAGIQPALSLQSEIVHLKQVEEGTTLGYGASYQSCQKEMIATIPIGYADGLLRGLQGFSLLVDGRSCPIVGRISMDQTLIRLPSYYPIGTGVTLIGSDKEASISVQDWADYLDTINYEVVCLLSDRLDRVYLNESSNERD